VSLENHLKKKNIFWQIMGLAVLIVVLVIVISQQSDSEDVSVQIDPQTEQTTSELTKYEVPAGTTTTREELMEKLAQATLVKATNIVQESRGEWLIDVDIYTGNNEGWPDEAYYVPTGETQQNLEVSESTTIAYHCGITEGIDQDLLPFSVYPLDQTMIEMGEVYPFGLVIVDNLVTEVFHICVP
jgi:hypothetical protein